MKRKITLVAGVCLSMALLAVQSHSQTDNANRKLKYLPDLERLRNMTEEERQRELAKHRKQRELESKQRVRDLKEKTKEVQKRQKDARQEREQELKEAGGRALLHAKRVLGATEDEWKLIKPKLEKVRDLQDRARSTVILGLSSSSASGSGSAKGPAVPTWQWIVSWKDKDPNELTEAQKIANGLMHLVDRERVAPGTLSRTIDALRKARRQETEIQKQLGEARRELREGLTPRQEAALVLMGWF